jgi:hypothetical protein
MDKMIKAASFSRSRKISMPWPAPLKGFLGVVWERPRRNKRLETGVIF